MVAFWGQLALNIVMEDDKTQANSYFKDVALALKEKANEERETFSQVLNEGIATRSSLVKDYATASFAILGAALTILTVNSSLAKTPALFYAGVTIVLVETVINFIARNEYINDRENKFVTFTKYHRGRMDILSTALSTDNPKVRGKKLVEFIDYKSYDLPRSKAFFNKAEVYLGIMLLAGGSMFAASLVFKITL